MGGETTKHERGLAARARGALARLKRIEQQNKQILSKIDSLDARLHQQNDAIRELERTLSLQNLALEKLILEQMGDGEDRDERAS